MYYLIKSLSYILCKLPFKAIDVLASIVGGIIYFSCRTQRFTAQMNLSLAFPEKNSQDLVKIVKRNFKEIALTFLEILRLPLLNSDIHSSSFKHVNRQYMEDAKKEKSVIFIGCHSGNWESVNIGTPSIMKYMVIVKRQKNAGFNRFITELRQKSGAKIIFDDDLRSITKYLKADYSIAIMYDHGFKNSPLFTKFLGMDVQVPKSAFTLAQKYNRKLYPVFFSREGSTNVIKYFKPYTINTDNVENVAQELSDIFENELITNPYQFLWSYKRFKRSNSKRIIVLSDSKPGHYNQSRSLDALLREEYPSSSSKTIELKVNRLQRLLFDFLVMSKLYKSFKRNLSILKIFFPKHCEQLTAYTDLVISTGSSLSSANRIISCALNSKSVILMKANVGTYEFDRVILPSHDLKKIKRINKKFVKIAGALKYADNSSYKSDCKKFINAFDIDPNEKYISLLIGGPTNNAEFCAHRTKDQLLLFKKFCQVHDYKILLTSSRRTPSWLEDFLDLEFAHAKVKIIANRENYSYAMNGLLNIPSKVVSTADSISMISEAATYKPTFILDIFNTCESSKKHGAFIDTLIEDKHIALIDGNYEILTEELSTIDNISATREMLKGLF